ncbi:MAG: membrane protein insertase YidC, partial [Pseudomonadota bacterium]
MGDNRNMFIAVALSLAVIIAWQFLFIEPRMEAERENQRQAQIRAEQTAVTPGADPAAVPTPQTAQGDIPAAPAVTGTDGVPQPAALPTAPGAPTSRDEAVSSGQRVTIDTPKVEGSISLAGARIDDLRLKDYHVTVDPESPTVVLLSPAGTAHPYFAETGWVP